MPQDDWAKIAEPAAPESLCSATREAAPEKPQLERGPCSPQLERALCTEHKTHCSQKWIIKLPLNISLVQPCCRKNNGSLKCSPPSPYLLRKCCLPWQRDFADEIKDPEIGRYPGWSSWDWCIHSIFTRDQGKDHQGLKMSWRNRDWRDMLWKQRKGLRPRNEGRLEEQDKAGKEVMGASRRNRLPHILILAP